MTAHLKPYTDDRARDHDGFLPGKDFMAKSHLEKRAKRLARRLIIDDNANTTDKALRYQQCDDMVDAIAQLTLERLLERVEAHHAKRVPGTRMPEELDVRAGRVPLSIMFRADLAPLDEPTTEATAT